MEEFIRVLDDAALEALQMLLGTPANQLFTAGLDMERGRAVAPSFSLGLPDRRFVIIESDWCETPQDGIDYHIMKVSVAETPKDVRVGPDENGYRVIQRPHSTVRLHPEGAALVKISVHTRDEATECERVRYDAVMIFEYEGGWRFALSTNESIAGGLRYTDSSDDLKEMQMECPERVAVGTPVEHKD